MSDPSATGRFVWHDLLTRDVAAAIPFYTNVARWGTEAFPLGEGPPYTMWTANGTALGGVNALAAGAAAKPHWRAYVGVADVDASARQAVSLGGSVTTPPTDIPTVGRYAVIADPQGATMALFTPLNQAAGAEGAAKIGEFSWHELGTTNWKSALTFYTTLFGWDKGPAHDMGPMGTYQIFERRGIQLGGIYDMMDAPPGPSQWLAYIRVDNADRAAERVTKNGGRVVRGAMDVPGGGRIAQCEDVSAAAFAVHSGG